MRIHKVTLISCVGYQAGVIGEQRWEHYKSTSVALENAIQALQDIKMPAKRWADFNITPTGKANHENVNDNGSMRR